VRIPGELRNKRDHSSTSGESNPDGKKQCPDCKEWIHKDASKCPHCQSNQPTAAPAVATIVTLVLFGTFFVWCTGVCSSSDRSSPRTLTRQEKLEQQFDPWDGSHIKLKEIIKSNMNDPNSFEHVDTIYRDHGDYIYIRTDYRGKNVFGGVVPGWMSAEFDIDGNLIRINASFP
jgi:hypothetical protein